MDSRSDLTLHALHENAVPIVCSSRVEVGFGSDGFDADPDVGKACIMGTSADRNFDLSPSLRFDTEPAWRHLSSLARTRHGPGQSGVFQSLKSIKYGARRYGQPVTKHGGDGCAQ
jgi:hypothetical protein